MKTRLCSVAATSLLFLALYTPFACAAPITVPAGLNPGDVYRLVFVTSGTIDATSSDITTYNDFVNAQASTLGLGNIWRAIASTPTKDALVNIGGIDSAPIYDLQGHFIDTGTGDLFDGNINFPIVIDQLGREMDNLTVWTGSRPDGTRSPGQELGTSSANSVAGSNLHTDQTWISFQLEPRGFGNNLYAISSDLTVTGTVPEPATLTMLMGGLALLGRRYRRTNRS